MTDQRPLPDSEEGENRRGNARLLRQAMVGLAVLLVLLIGFLVMSRVL